MYKRQHQTYDDLAALIRAHDTGQGLGDHFDVRGFIRWAAVNTLLGAWDNYWRTPANYYLYNAGPASEPRGFMERPMFHWIPWDYDNALGLAYDDTTWQTADIVRWRDPGQLPLLDHVLANREHLLYYVAELERLVTERFNEDQVGRQIETLWAHISTAAYLESDTAHGAAHTGRQFTNDQVHWNGYKGQPLRRDSARTMGIQTWVRLRRQNVLEQISRLRNGVLR